MTAKERKASKQREWYLANREKTLERAKAWKAANPERAAELNKASRGKHYDREKATARATYQANAEQAAAKLRARRTRRLERLAGRPKPDTCEVCGDGGKICWDHCHRSSMFRGWICQPCNTALGMVRDSEFRLKALIKYLRKNDATLAVAA